MSHRATLPKSVTTLTPLRVSFFGGGTDLPKYYMNHGGAVISSAIDKYIQVTVKRHSPLFDELYRINYSKTENVTSLEDIENDIARECLRLVPIDPPLYIGTIADLPASSGLGSSSSFAVGLLHALHVLRGERVPAAQLAEEACHVEINILRNPIGKQDQYAAAFGGLNHIIFKKNNRVEIDHLALHGKLINDLFSHCVLVWTGVQRSASTILKNQSKNAVKDHKKYTYLTKSTESFKKLLLNPPPDLIPRFGRLLAKAWDAKKLLENTISSDDIDLLHQQFLREGSYGGKLCGAGGGGFLLEVMSEEKILKAIKKLGLKKIIRLQHEPLGTRLISEIY
jgi:D-glycero-alpha-D-manno-heptose-7-phosphate kinase